MSATHSGIINKDIKRAAIKKALLAGFVILAILVLTVLALYYSEEIVDAIGLETMILMLVTIIVVFFSVGIGMSVFDSTSKELGINQEWKENDTGKPPRSGLNVVVRFQNGKIQESDNSYSLDWSKNIENPITHFVCKTV